MDSTVAVPESNITEVKATIIVNPNGLRMFEGISDHYDDVFPAELRGVIPEHMFYQTMNRINHFVFAYYPSRVHCGCRGAGADSCPKFIHASMLISALADILDAENRDRYEPFRLRWYYVKRMNYVLNRMECVIEIKFFVKMNCHN